MPRILGFFICIFVILAPKAVHAQANICADLRSQLASLPPEGTNNSLVQQQLNEIQKARNDLLRLNCGSLETQSNSNKMQNCERISDALESMEQNYIRLSRNAGNTRTAAIRADILNQIRANDCDKPSTQPQNQQQFSSQQAPRGDQEGNFLTWLFGRIQNKPTTGNGIPLQQNPISPDSDGQVEIGGALRTVCVRKCDGYYWPISFSTSARAFGRDAEACQKMCPTQETELFYHHINGQWSDDMVSVGGTPYKSMSYAFNYRASYNPSCSCRPTTKLEKNANIFDWKPNQAGNSGAGISQVPLSPLSTSLEKNKSTPQSRTSEKSRVEIQVEQIENSVGSILPTKPFVSDGALTPVPRVNSQALSTPQNLGVDVSNGGASSVDYNALREVPRAR